MKTNRRAGFTLVELNLSMAFIAILILGVAFTAMHVSKIYQRGVTVKTVNQVGRDVFEQMRRDFANANQSKVNFTEVGNGRVCLGHASYLYNDALKLNEGGDGIRHDGELITLVRINDPEGVYCQRTDGVYARPNIPAGTTFTELLEVDAIPLALHNFEADTYLAQTSGDLQQSLFRLKITLGTNEVDTISDNEAGSANCKPPTDNTANFDACFVSEFETVVRAGGVIE